jgi:uncharacterized protein YgbK (DUF1537 family)
MYSGLVIADDLTGATDTGHQFAANGYRTAVASGSAADVDVDVLVVDTDSRTAPASAARRTVSEVASTHCATVVYKKVDSTLRGNVAAETGAVLGALDPGVAVVAPAFPANGRVTAGGYHLVDGDPVDVALDGSESPPPTADVVEMFSECGYPVEHLPIGVVARGTDAVARRLRSIEGRHERAVVVCDAVRAAHLTAVADAGAAVDAAMYVGSAGLADHVTLGDPPRRDVLGVVGSTNERTVEQLAAIPDDRVVELDCEAAVRAPREAGEEAGGRAAERFASTTRVVVSSVGSWTPDRLYEMGAERVGIGRDAVERRIATALTTATETCWREAGPDGLFATGGTVARSVLDALGVETIELTGRAVEEGIPVAHFESGGDTKGLVTKAGGFGGPDAIRRCLDALGTL